MAMTTDELEEIDAAPLWKVPQDELMNYYERVGDECEPHAFDCQCKTCSLFMAIGDEVNKRRRALSGS